MSLRGRIRGADRMFRCSSLVALMTALATAGPALAQQRSEGEGKRQAALPSTEEIIVTGSRIERRGQTAPTPVTVLGEKEISHLNLVNAADMVAQLPQSSAFTSMTNVGRGVYNVGAVVANLRGLNPFYGTRTLALVDTRRYVPTTNAGAVDLNVVPSMLIQRVETVTGGASAAYGSDAVAGVVNVILDKKLQGLKAQADYGVTTHGDGDDVHASLAGGTGFAGGRGHIVVGAEYQRSDLIGSCPDVRDWCAQAYGVLTNAGYATNGQPHYIVGPNGRAYNSDTGLFPFAGLQFNQSGTALVPFPVGNYANLFSIPTGPQMQGGADDSQNTYRGVILRPEVERYSVLGHVEYELSDSLNGFAELSFAGRKSHGQQPNIGSDILLGGNVVMPDNAYLPASAAPLFAFGPQPFQSNGNALPVRDDYSRINVYRGVVGLNGKIAGSWNWDVYYTYGRTESQKRLTNMKAQNFFAFALDAVDNPATPGFDPVCRATLPGPAFNPAAAGCSPINLFGVGNSSSTGLAYAFRTLHQDELYQQHVVAATVRGDLHQGWGAGPVSFAAGGEYRHESISVDHDIVDQPWYSQYELSLGDDYAGGLDVIEGFAELSVPLLKDAPFAKFLSLDGAIRQTHNKNENATTGRSISIDFTTWKLSGIWDVNDWVRFRATRSRDVRVGSFYEQYGSAVANGGFFGSVHNPWAGGAFQPVQAVSGTADPGLTAEKADTWTAGTVLTGQGALRGAYFSADWYQIDLKGPISTLGVFVQSVVNACFNQGAYCYLLNGTGPVPGGGYTNITSVHSPYLNLGSYLTRGIDLEMGYRMGLKNGTSISLRAIGTYLYDQIIDYGTGGPVYNYAGVSGPTASYSYFNTSPKWQANAFVTFESDRFSGTIQARYVGPGKLALLNPNSGLPYVAPGDPGYSTTNPDSINKNKVDSRLYINLNAAVRPFADRKVELFASVNNLFDVDPPVAPGGNGYPANPVFFDTIGRSFRMGVRVQY